nr:hypothetical protein [Streptomyces sp. FXJ7.023]
MLLDAAKSLAPLDPALSRETYLDALDAAIVTGDRGPGGVRAVADAARAAPAPPESPRPVDLLLDGLVTTFTQGYAAGVPGLRRALDAFNRHERDDHAANDGDARRWLWLAGRTAMSVFDDQMVHALAARHVRLVREAGALATLPAALLVQSVMLVLSGEFSRAAEQTAIAAATRTVPVLHGQLILAAWRGRPDETTEVHANMVREAVGRGGRTEDFLAQYAMAVLHNGLGDYPAALVAATRAFESDELTHSNLAHSELIEAACRSGRPERATAALDQLSSRALASGTPWGLGLAARSRALVSTGPAAEEYYREAIEQLRNCRRGPPPRPPPAAPHCPPVAVGHGCGGVRRARRPRAARHRRAPTQPVRPALGRAHRAGADDRPAGSHRGDLPGGRRTAVLEPAHH